MYSPHIRDWRLGIPLSEDEHQRGAAGILTASYCVITRMWSSLSSIDMVYHYLNVFGCLSPVFTCNTQTKSDCCKPWSWRDRPPIRKCRLSEVLDLDPLMPGATKSVKIIGTLGRRVDFWMLNQVDCYLLVPLHVPDMAHNFAVPMAACNSGADSSSTMLKSLP